MKRVRQSHEFHSAYEICDPDALLSAIASNPGRMLSLARKFLPCPQDAEDAVQSAMVRAYRNIEKFDRTRLPGLSVKDAFDVWFHSILTNQCRTARQRALLNHSRQVSINCPILLDGTPIPLEDVLADPQDMESAIIERFGAQHIARVIFLAMERMPPEQSEAIRAYYAEEGSYAEVAVRIGCNPEQARHHLYRAKLQLQEILSELLGVPVGGKSGGKVGV